MALTATKGEEREYKQAAEGIHIGTCFAVFDLGTQESTWNDEVKLKHQVMLCWELADERIEYEDKDGKAVNAPLSIKRTYTLSLDKRANLRRDLEGWRGKAFTPDEEKAFDLRNVLGKACQLQVVHNVSSKGKTYANVQTVLALPKGIPVPELENELLWFSLEETVGTELPENMWEWVALIVQESNEWQERLAAEKALNAQGEMPVDNEPVALHPSVDPESIESAPEPEPEEEDNLPF